MTDESLDTAEDAPIVTIVQLYPDLLGITGDRGNVEVLTQRLRAAGIAPRVIHVGLNEAIPENVDVIVIGNGPLSAMRQVVADLAQKADALRAHVEGDRVLLAVGAGAELLSSGVKPLDGEPVAGIGVFPFGVTRTRERRVGYLTASTEHGELIGFEDHASTWATEPGVVPYGRVTAGRGSIAPLGVGAGETVRRANAYATNIQGPVLPLNPQLADALLVAATSQRGLYFEVGDTLATIDALAEGARTDIRGLVNAKAITAIGL